MIKRVAKRLVQSVINPCLGTLDLALVRPGRGFAMGDALARWKEVEIATVIDIGASNGSWSAEAMRSFPGASYFLIEAQRHPHELELQKFKAGHANVDFVISAAGDREGSINFDATDPWGGLASDKPFAENNIVVPVITVDGVVKSKGLKGPFLLKLDTHGFEVPILEGARRTLEQTSLLVIEVYNFEVCPGSLKYWEMCAFLEKLGFRCLDMCDPIWRQRDGVLWQHDLLFGRGDMKCFATNSY